MFVAKHSVHGSLRVQRYVLNAGVVQGVELCVRQASSRVHIATGGMETHKGGEHTPTDTLKQSHRIS